MVINEITSSFSYIFYTILHVKLRNFIKRNVWLYMLTSLLMAWGINVIFNSSVISCFLVIFGSLIVLSMAIMLISSQILYQRKKKDSIDIIFTKDKITVLWKYQGKKEDWGWNWVKSFEEANGIYYFDLNVWPRNIVIIRKENLNDDENIAIYDWLQKNNKIKGSAKSSK